MRRSFWMMTLAGLLSLFAACDVDQPDDPIDTDIATADGEFCGHPPSCDARPTKGICWEYAGQTYRDGSSPSEPQVLCDAEGGTLLEHGCPWDENTAGACVIGENTEDEIRMVFDCDGDFGDSDDDSALWSSVEFTTHKICADLDGRWEPGHCEP